MGKAKLAGYFGSPAVGQSKLRGAQLQQKTAPPAIAANRRSRISSLRQIDERDIPRPQIFMLSFRL